MNTDPTQQLIAPQDSPSSITQAKDAHLEAITDYAQATVKQDAFDVVIDTLDALIAAVLAQQGQEIERLKQAIDEEQRATRATYKAGYVHGKYGDSGDEDGVGLIIAERERQKAKEGYSDAHDDTHGDFEMMRSAVAYALHAGGFTNASDHWPFGSCEWKPSVADPVRDLVKAGALIAAEIDRLQRLSRPLPDRLSR
jgi:hypothetical protein